MDVARQLAEAAKAQKVRAFDIYALGPFMIWAALASGKGALPRWPRRMLFVAGVYTIIYNLDNYRKTLEILKEETHG